ncbi:MAG TPA: hypothetical protein IAC31_09750 [Candidatus Faecousia intestinigallinarum]|nr:hypothetical protein [Candidatus Faecousia intestinigallinarum]
MSRILCIIDGMTDPGFSAADFPNLASMLYAGEIDTAKGGKVESLNCILHLLGVEQFPQNLRGYVEALAEGIPVKANDLILRGSWLAVDQLGNCGGPVRGAARIAVPEEKYQYYLIDQYKALLIFPGMASYVDKIVTYPPYGNTERKALSYRPKGCPDAEKCFDTWLQENRCLVPWGESVCSALPPFPEKSAVISGTSVVKGIAKLLQMEYIPVKGATGDTDTDLPAKAAAALEAARHYPFVVLHINGADEAAHRHSESEKRQFLLKIDSIVLPSLIHSGHEIMVVGDHGTDPQTGLHIGKKQPYFINYKET